ncbi:cation diffusion facilitator family transporter [Candidatus Kaiserbacteria bacterium]|nr:cation diffusion facilitator family transporter [Candidatus Kaiserbacteria bacterium]
MSVSDNTHTVGLWPVIAALGGNTIVTVFKFTAAITSGSSAMFSEAIHSVADTSNQVLLLIGLKRSRKKADEDFGYGYGLERFFWALLSACGVFFVGAGVTISHGIGSLLEPHPIEIQMSVFVVLFVSLVVESWTLFLAVRSLERMFPDHTWRERMAIADPTTLAVCLEDGVAVIGVILAAASIGLSYYTRNPLWDAIGSLLIGLMLAGVATTLIMRNKSYLLGRAIPEDLKEEIIASMKTDPAIEKVIDFKSSVLDIGVYRIKCEVEMTGSALLKEIYKHNSLKEEYEEVHNDFEEFKKFCVGYSNRIPRMIGKHIDKLEARLRKEFPAVRHIDIEIN